MFNIRVAATRFRSTSRAASTPARQFAKEARVGSADMRPLPPPSSLPATGNVPLEHSPEPGCCLVHDIQRKQPLGEAPKRPVLDYSLYPTSMGTSMKALVKQSPKEGLVLSNVEHPAIGDSDVLIKVAKAAICGTDLHIWNWDAWSQRTVPTPMVTGHEFVGYVAEIGRSVKGVAVGDRVTGEGHITCGYCRNCRAGKRHLCRNTIGLGVNRPGCFAEFVQLPAMNVFPVPKAVPDDIAAFMDPLGNAVHSALSFSLVGEDVLITGAGPIGMMCAAICKQVGARHVVVTDVNDYRLNIARHCGADAAVNVTTDGVGKLHETMKWLGMKEGFDVGLEMSGNEHAFRAMLATMNHGGNISLLGIPPGPFSIDWDKIIFKGLTVKGIYGREMFETWYKMSNLLTSGLTERIRPVVTHVIAADDYARGFKACGSSQSGKVILDWQ